VGVLRARCISLALALAFAAGAARADRRGEVTGFEDALGHWVVEGAPPQRIVSLSPNLTEILFAIGLDSTRVVGVTRFCDYPPAATRIARVGGIVDPSLEAIVALHPDLVLATRGNPLEFIESLRGLKIPVYALEDRGDLRRIFSNVRDIGKVTRRAAAGDSLALALERRAEAVASRTASLPLDARPWVYFGELEGALWTAGPGSYIDDLIRVSGGRNVGSLASTAWSPLALESIVMRDPEVYLGTFTGADTAGHRAEVEARIVDLLRTREGWSGTRLGRSPRVFLVHEDRLQRPGPRVVDVLEEFARFLHPELRGGRDAAR
jgi:iron complex transport system substrate-binding protein